MRNGMQSAQANHNVTLAHPERCCTPQSKARAAFGCMRVLEMFTINGGQYANSLQDHSGLVGVVFRQRDVESRWRRFRR